MLGLLAGLACTLLAFALPLCAPAKAQTAPGRLVGTTTQTRPAPARPRTRIRVAPAYPYRLESTPYPVPYPVEFPGPGFVRQCRSWLATESRISGPVIVPHMRCWWQRG